MTPTSFASTKKRGDRGSKKGKNRPGGDSSQQDSIVAVPGSRCFLGQAVARYDIDELDDLGKLPQKRDNQYVEVQRPDGSVAKSRGERTFYGAFEGGFSAGYWGTVGSKEGWEPASFSSSRTNKNQNAAPQVEDFMDEEDLREHQSSHKTIAAHGEFAGRETRGARALEGQKALPGGLPRSFEEEIFAADSVGLGARLLLAGGTAAEATPNLAITGTSSSSSSTTPAQATAGKKVYGVARPPTGYVAPPVPAAPRPRDEPEEFDGSMEFTPVLAKRPASVLGGTSVAEAPLTDRALEAELERLWRSKTNLHGVGYAGGSSPAADSLPSERRLYMSSGRAANLNSKSKALGYGNFGTGVLDQEEYDVWEEVYDHSADKGSQYHASLGDEGGEDADAGRVAALEDIRSSSRGPTRNANTRAQDTRQEHEGVLGFAPATRPEHEASDFSKWAPPSVPQGYRGHHLIKISPAQEAHEGSEEHRKLQEFLERHGSVRIEDPRCRAELLGEKVRPRWQEPAPQQPGPEASPEAIRSSAENEAAKFLAMQDSTMPLWGGVSDVQKQTLLATLGRTFVTGQGQDMEGGSVHHEPFKSDAKKQKRYARFCLALEGKTSASEALRDTGGLSEGARAFELEEFGRVYRSFRQQNPDVDMAAALEERAHSGALAPVLRRMVTAWQPEKLLCRRWGVPDTHARGFSGGSVAEDLRGAKLQRKYQEQVEAGLAAAAGKVAVPLPASTGAGELDAPSSAAAPAAAATTVQAAGAGDFTRPPKSLFASIFGDDDDDA